MSEATGGDEVSATLDQVRDWLAEVWDPERPLSEWREILVRSGWGCPAWPKRWHGRGLPETFSAPVGEVFAEMGAVGAATGAGMSMAAPTLLAHGSDDLKSRLLWGMATGQDRWCQLFSEPGSGSDLAGVTTRAERDGDEWVVNGQKVWNTGAGRARYGMLLARTNLDVPKHEGITYFVLPMDQVGIEVRPLRQMNNYSSFTEVFLTDARVPAGNIVGTEGTGWRVARTTLMYERGVDSRRFAPPAPGLGRTQREAAEEAAEYYQTYKWYPQRMGRSDLVVAHARKQGRANDPLVRQELARVLGLEMIAKWTSERNRQALLLGAQPGAEGSMIKLLASEIAKRCSAIHGVLAGPWALTSDERSDLGHLVSEIIVSVPAQSIAGGTDEIQRNILAERVLGLPRENVPDRAGVNVHLGNEKVSA